MQVFDAILHKPLQFADPCWELISKEAKDIISRWGERAPSYTVYDTCFKGQRCRRLLCLLAFAHRVQLPALVQVA